MRNSELLEKLSSCINHCNYCADACLDEENVKEMRDCIRLDRICASVCASLADVLASDFHQVQGLVKYCQEICESCASECGKHKHQHCQDCAEACRKCAAACAAF